MPNLGELQSLLLSHASQQAGGSLYPLPDTINDPRRTARPIVALLRAGLIEEREANTSADVARTDGDLRFGLYLMPAGAAAIGIELEDGPAANVPLDPVPPSVPTASTPGLTKIARVIDLLSREGGACVPDLIEATGWLPHTTRAALTGLRKKGHRIEKERVGEVTRYRIAAVTA